jgi:hypothetical protein
VGSYPGSMHDPDIDGCVKLPPKPVPMTRVPWLLAAVAFMSVAWGAVSIMLFLRAERSRRQGHDHLSSPEATSTFRGASPASIERVSVSRPLLALIPDSIRDKGLPGSQISLAADVRAAEQRSGASIRRSLEATGPRPDGATMAAQMAALDGLRLHVQPGRQIEGWLMQVAWVARSDKDPRYFFKHVPPGYSVALRFPETLAGYEIWLSGYSYDSLAKGFRAGKGVTGEWH